MIMPISLQYTNISELVQSVLLSTFHHWNWTCNRYAFYNTHGFWLVSGRVYIMFLFCVWYSVEFVIKRHVPKWQIHLQYYARSFELIMSATYVHNILSWGLETLLGAFFVICTTYVYNQVCLTHSVCKIWNKWFPPALICEHICVSIYHRFQKHHLLPFPWIQIINKHSKYLLCGPKYIPVNVACCLLCASN